MTDGAAITVEGLARSATQVLDSAQLAISVTARIEDLEDAWDMLAAKSGAESPGQSFAFIRLWADSLQVPERDRVFALAKLDGRPLVILPLQRKRGFGGRVLTWLPGHHVGCNAPIADTARLLAMAPEDRRRLWHAMTATLGADALRLDAVPALPQFAELGSSSQCDTLYRSEFSDWESANTTQRSKSRRKHDRQQGERLTALGAVAFETLTAGAERLGVLRTMFRQRAARFVAMGISDPFATPQVRAFYEATLDPASGVEVVLHALRLNDEVVAVRYNVMIGTRMFCLISSMSDDPRIQGGSPGKQCLLRVMQTVFDNGARSFDMGSGFTDEKRHWCNVQIPVRQHYLPLTARGYLSVFAQRNIDAARRGIKSNPALLTLAKRVRAIWVRGQGAPASLPDGD